MSTVHEPCVCYAPSSLTYHGEGLVTLIGQTPPYQEWPPPYSVENPHCDIWNEKGKTDFQHRTSTSPEMFDGCQGFAEPALPGYKS